MSDTVKTLAFLHEQARYQRQAWAGQNRIFAAMLLGEEISIMGKPARVRIEWVDGQPMTDEQIRDYAAALKATSAGS